MILKHCFNIFIVCILLFSIMHVPGYSATLPGHIIPEVIYEPIVPGQCISEHKQLFIPAPTERIDIVFAVDTSMSMESCMDEMRTIFKKLIFDLTSMYPDMAFGVVSFHSLG